jgi:hypothetical protein
MDPKPRPYHRRIIQALDGLKIESMVTGSTSGRSGPGPLPAR